MTISARTYWIAPGRLQTQLVDHVPVCADVHHKSYQQTAERDEEDGRAGLAHVFSLVIFKGVQ